MSIPGIGPLIATAIEALAPPVETFRSGRDFAAWVGLTPLKRSTGGKRRPPGNPDSAPPHRDSHSAPSAAPRVLPAPFRPAPRSTEGEAAFLVQLESL